MSHNNLPQQLAAALGSRVEGGAANIEGLTEELMRNPELVFALQQELNDLEGQSSGFLESLPRSVRRRVDALKNIQAQHLELEVAYQKEVAELERKYLALYTPLYEKRSAIVSGEYEPTEEESKARKTKSEDQEDTQDGEGQKAVTRSDNTESATDEGDDDDEEFEGIPDFWLAAMANCPEVEEWMEECDGPILSELKDIKVELLPGANSGFKLSFVFGPNEFFENEVLTKTYHLQPEPEDDELVYEGPVLMRTEGCEIKWKPGKNVTEKVVKKKQRKKSGSGSGKIRTLTKTVKQDSFFHFFNPPKVDDSEEEDEEMLQQLLSMDYAVGDSFKEKVIPLAVLWFTGEALDYEDLDDEEEGDEEDDDDGPRLQSGITEIGDDDDDDEEADPTYQPPPEGEKPPECKAQ